MKKAKYNTTKNTAFEVCKQALIEYECDISNSDISLGNIYARKSGGILSYGYEISVNLLSTGKGTYEISVSSKSISIQVFDWGTNSVNEEKLIGIIEKSLG